MHTSESQGDFVSCIERGCDAWRRGDDSEGVSWFQQACILWLDVLEREPMEESEAHVKTLDQITNWLGKFMDCLEDSDIIRATDILEFNILPLLKSREAEEEGSYGREK
ncbi:MAG: hypothetical protein K6T83_07730 [Alicyclobacillus sp.]|nr:hypothetical protein [Alicyclobacillus sp.]